jgi:hypothetical protein
MSDVTQNFSLIKHKTATTTQHTIIPKTQSNMTASTSRIPESLQNVFVASQTGEDVDMIMAPAEGVSCKTFAPSGGCNSDSYALRKSRPSALGIKLLNRADHVGVTAADATKVLLRQQRASQRFLVCIETNPKCFIQNDR